MKLATESKIKSKAGYNKLMKKINEKMKKGEKNLSSAQLNNLRSMAEDAEKFEDEYYPLPMPSSIEEMIELKMFQFKIPSQAKLAEIMGIGTPKLSQILNKKREPDVAFLKAAYKKLKIDPAFLLEKI